MPASIALPSPPLEPSPRAEELIPVPWLSATDTSHHFFHPPSPPRKAHNTCDPYVQVDIPIPSSFLSVHIIVRTRGRIRPKRPDAAASAGDRRERPGGYAISDAPAFGVRGNGKGCERKRPQPFHDYPCGRIPHPVHRSDAAMQPGSEFSLSPRTRSLSVRRR
jgi:hypothetical protein